MVRQRPVVFLQTVGEQRLQRHRNAVVQFLALSREQTTVGCILGKGMLEHVRRLRRHAPRVEQLGVWESGQMSRQLPLCQPRHFSKQCLAPLTAHDRSDLEHTFGTFQKPIDTGHKHFLDRIRYRHSRRLGRETPLAVVGRNGPRFTQCSHQLFDAAGRPLGFVKHEPDQLILDMGRAEQGGQHLGAIRGRQWSEGNDVVIRLARPGADKLWPVRAQRRQ